MLHEKTSIVIGVEGVSVRYKGETFESIMFFCNFLKVSKGVLHALLKSRGVFVSSVPTTLPVEPFNMISRYT